MVQIYEDVEAHKKSQKKNDVFPPSKVVSWLSQVLADTYLLYLKTQNFHWNIVDPRFSALHKFLEDQYKNLADSVDELAERIRMVGGTAPASFKDFLHLATLKEPHGHLSGDEMLLNLLHDHDKLILDLRDLINKLTDLSDHGSADLLIERVRFHEKAAWMLRSHFLK